LSIFIYDMKVKVKKVKVPAGSDDLSDMFNQMLMTGDDSVNVAIAYPRYIRVKNLCESMIKVFETLESCPLMRTKEFTAPREEIRKYCEESRATMADLFSVSLADYEWNIKNISQATRDSFIEKYTTLKKSDFINMFIIICDKLVPYKANFTDLNKLNHKFITSMPGLEWTPLVFTNLNIKQIFCMKNIGENTTRFIMTLLYKTFEFSSKIYEEMSSPDIDVEEFSKLIMNSIEEIQTRPELNRCKKAFKKVKESIGMLNNNFGSYYKDFIITKDSTIIMQHFMLDVNKTTDNDPELAAQFRTIIAYYRKAAQQNTTNPKVKALFDKINDSMKEFERGAENLVDIRKEQPAPDVPSVSNPTAKTAEDL